MDELTIEFIEHRRDGVTTVQVVRKLAQFEHEDAAVAMSAAREFAKTLHRVLGLENL